MPSTNEGEQVETGLPVAQGDEEQVEKSANEEVQVGEAVEKPKINLKNWLNLGAYVLNIVFTFGVGTNGWFGNGTNGELSEKYQVRVHASVSRSSECLEGGSNTHIPLPSLDNRDTSFRRLSYLDSHFPHASNLCYCPVSSSLSWHTNGPTRCWILVLLCLALSSGLDVCLCLRSSLAFTLIHAFNLDYSV